MSGGPLPPPTGAPLPPPQGRPVQAPAVAGGNKVTGALAAAHRSLRRRPWWLQALWWVLLLPVAVACWAATQRRTGMRVAGWIGAGALALTGVAAVAASPDEDDGDVIEAGASGSTADAPVPVTVATTTTSGAPTTSTTSVATTTTTTTTTSTTTTTTVAPTTVPGSRPALDVLAGIVVENERPANYDRSLFAEGLDADGDGCQTRAEVLIRESLTPAQVDAFGCAVVAGDWLSAYDGVTTSDPAELEVDHVVALKEAWDSGARDWTPERRAAFANDLDDPRTLRAVTSASNQDKGDKDPSNWLPPLEADWCRYLGDWVAIKARWGLTMDQSEAGRIRNAITDRCPGLVVAPWPAAPPLAVAPPPTPPPDAQPGDPRAGCDPSYPDVCIPPPPPDLDCGDIVHRRFRVIPPDPHGFDGNDDDGVGCEG